MPVKQSELNFPIHKTRSSSQDKCCKVPPTNARSKKCLPEDASIKRIGPVNTRKLAVAAISLDNNDSNDSSHSHTPSKKRTTPSKRKHEGAWTVEDELFSPTKSPRRALQLPPGRRSGSLVSPVKLKVFGSNCYRTINKAGKQTKDEKIKNGKHCKESEEVSDEDDVTARKSRTKTSKCTNAKGKNTKSTLHKKTICIIISSDDEKEHTVNEIDKSLNNVLDSSACETIPCAPTPSPANDNLASPLKHEVFSSSLSADQLQHRLSTLASDQCLMPAKDCRNKKTTSDQDKENTPVKETSSSYQSFPSPFRLSSVTVNNSSVKTLNFEGVSPHSPGRVPFSDLANCKSIPLKNTAESSKNIIFSPRRQTPKKLDLDINFKSPNKTPLKCVVNLSLKNIFSQAKSPLEQLDSTINHLRSPLKQPQLTSPEVRRSPRKHNSFATSPLRGLASPVRSLTLGDGPCKGSQPDLSVYHAVRQSLSHNLTALVGRQHEVDAITSFLRPRLNERRPGALYISGAPGTGKTAALTHVLDNLKECRAISPVWVNCMGLHSSSSVYGRIALELRVTVTGGSSTELRTVRAIEKKITRSKDSIVLVLDEIDQLETRQQDVLYTLFEWPALQGSSLVLLAIANRLDLTERALPRLTASAAVAPQRLHFPPYTRQQILDILSDRLEKSGVAWRDVVRPTALTLLAGKVAAVAGDVRRALDVCRRAVETCTSRAQQWSQGTPLPVVDMPHILRVFMEVYGSCVVTAITAAPAAFPLQQKVLLCCLLLISRHGKAVDATMGQLEDVYRSVCSRRHIPPVDASEFRSLCGLLETRGMLAITASKVARMAKVSLRLNQAEAEHALADRDLMLQILDDREALGRLAKKLAPST